MATQAFPPTPAQGAPKPSPVGTAAAGAQPNMKQLISQAASGLQALKMLGRIVSQQNPQAGEKLNHGIAEIMEGVNMLKGGGTPAPTAPKGAVPPPPQVAAESPEQTPEAT